MLKVKCLNETVFDKPHIVSTLVSHCILLECYVESSEKRFPTGVLVYFLDKQRWCNVESALLPPILSGTDPRTQLHV